MRKPNLIALTSSELGYLWTGYSINEMSKWFLIIFHDQAKDQEVKELYALALQITNELLETRGKILSEEGYPIPVGFTDSDIDGKSPTLFTDRFLLYYLHGGSRLGLDFHTKALALATREDVRKHHIACINTAVQLNESVVNLLLNKGLYWRTPTLPPPKSPEKIQKASYLDGWFGDTRPINSMEMANLYSSLELLVMIDTLSKGFAQTSSEREMEELFLMGRSVAKSHFNQLIEVLKKDELPLPPTYSFEITDSKERVFSDKIMLCHLAGLLGALITQYGSSLGSAMKHDLVTNYLTLIGKGGAYTEKITKYLIDHEWLEKVPGIIDTD